MLRSFRLGNHRSFRDEQELLLVPSYDKQRSVVPVAAVCGANASGKSNLLDGLRFMRQAVLYSFSRWDVEGGVPRDPHRLSEDAQSAPSTYVAEIVVDSVPYVYGFTVDDERVREEWLYSYPEKRKRILLERDGQNFRFGSKTGESKTRLEMVEGVTRENSLFFSAAIQSGVPLFAPVYHWFRSFVAFGRGGKTGVSRFVLARRVGRFIEASEASRRTFVDLLSAADVGITDVQMEDFENDSRVRNLERQLRRAEESGDSDALSRVGEELERARATGPRSMQKVQTVHGEHGPPFDVSDESAGTRSWLELLPDVLDALRDGKVLVVDEIDTSLHPLLTSKLVGLFQDERTNPHGAQLVFTTHGTSLLGTMLDGAVLERDQVWFVEKNADGVSDLYALSDFRPRQEENTERRYFGGSYGAIPFVDQDRFLTALRGEA